METYSESENVAEGVQSNHVLVICERLTHPNHFQYDSEVVLELRTASRTTDMYYTGEAYIRVSDLVEYYDIFNRYIPFYVDAYNVTWSGPHHWYEVPSIRSINYLDSF